MISVPRGSHPAAPGGALLISALSFAMATGATGTYSFSTLSPFLTQELGLSAGSIGMLLSGLYVVAASSSGVIGRIADRADPVWVILIGATCSLLASVALASTFGWPGLVVTVILGGLAMSASNPGSNGMIAHRIPPGSRAFATGIKQSGATGAGLYLAVVLPPLAVLVGWRLAALAAIVIPMLAIATVLAGRKAPAAQLELELEAPQSEVHPSRARWLGWLALYALLLGVATGICNGFYVLYATHLGFGAVTAGFVFGVFALASVGARVVWARLTERGARPAVLLQVVAALGACSALFCLAAPFAGPWIIWIAAALAGSTIVGWNALGMVTIMLNVPRRAVGVSAARMLRGFFVGLAIGPLLFGLLVEVSDYLWGWILQLVVLLLAVGAAAMFGRTVARPISAADQGDNDEEVV
ncbi:MFS transporter [Microbacterium sp. PI-1]|uniref:MFS transporter n=1 Tax=Microbacterium sp. PI-1 TaxID=2545631 RepID=UPI00103F52C2|nr:MFS transporter [Microbacterium sp. PI-1]TCJ21967.1 MFS transporter [Microbacterium sp. PI-1]